VARESSRPQEQKVNLHRGDVYLVSFDPSKKTRPALVIQNNIGNRYSSLTIVAAITSKISTVLHPVEVIIQPSRGNGLEVLSAIRLDQVCTLDKLRLVKRLGSAGHSTMLKVEEAIRISLGLIII
jgi:mRNA interferase MazF